MNPEIRKLGLIAFAAALPLTALAESSSQSNPSSTSPASTPSSSSNSPSSTSPNSTNPASRFGNTSENANASNSSTMTSNTPSVSGNSIGSIQRVNDEILDRQFTAKDLIGKEVYDNRDKRIGEIRDVVLDSTQFRQLASAISSRESRADASGTLAVNAGSDTTVSGAVNSSDRSSSRVNSDSPNSVATNKARADATSVRTEPALAAASSEPAAIISHGGLLGVGNDLLRVPLSQLNFDQNTRHLTIKVSEQQLSSLQSPGDSVRAATE